MRHTPLRMLTLLAFATSLALPAAASLADDAAEGEQPVQLIDNARQLTFAGRRSGEGYFSADGSKMIFQSEREEGNPFYQIYLMDLETGDIRRVSPGVGKTTCAWIHPSGSRALFASTHHDPQAEAKQTEELEKRAAGEQDRYAWDYDPHYELYAVDLETGELTAVTDAHGYDAEASYSPDGRHILFASNRHAYEQELSEAERSRFELDPSYKMDLYIMEADGSNVRRLTEADGYDGGPFFSADGSKIVWRRFDSEQGHTAEIWTMDVDGSNKQQITDTGVMSWAPYFHPSGDYIIYTSNKYGFDNFELHIVDAAGEREPVRVTTAEGFDGLPVFTPDGTQLAWTSNRGGESQIYLADWDDAAARELLQLDEPSVATETEADAEGVVLAEEAFDELSAEVTAADVERHIRTLASERMTGRLTGTDGERMATAYAAELFRRIGLEPAGDDGTYFQSFEFTAGVSLGDGNALALDRDGDTSGYQLNEDWRPLAFSETGEIEAGPIVFAGYGIVAPATDGVEEYDSYVHLDVAEKWVLALRYIPEDVDDATRQHLNRHASLRYKAMAARDRGAKGIIFVSGPNAQVREQLVPLRFDASLSGTSIPVLSITDEVATEWLAAADKDLQQLHNDLDTGEPMMGFDVAGVSLAAEIEIIQEKSTGRNVLARLPADGERDEAVLVGAHIDHLGDGSASGSLATEDEEDGIHFGADDNASGVAALLEIAHYLQGLKADGKLDANRDVMFAAWSGEELGLLGSSHFADTFSPPTAPAAHAEVPHPPHDAEHAAEQDEHPHGGAEDEADHAAAHGGGEAQSHPHAARGLHPAIAAYVNMDMVGRYEDSLTLQGVGSSSAWEALIERANVPVGLSINTQQDAYLPTDSTPFFVRGVPILSAFTGAHEDYHTPRDTADRIDFEATQRVARFMALLTRQIVLRAEAPDYVPQQAPEREQRAGLRAFLGTVPDYAGDDVEGVKLSGVSANGPADEAGLQGGDVIIELAGREIENIYDYTYAIDALKIGEETNVVVRRGDETLDLTITPASRE